MRLSHTLALALMCGAHPVAGQAPPLEVAGCVALWQAPGEPSQRTLMAPYVEFVNAPTVERSTGEDVVTIPVTPEFAVLHEDPALGWIMVWQFRDETIHIVLDPTGDELTGEATLENLDTGHIRRMSVALEPVPCR